MGLVWVFVTTACVGIPLIKDAMMDTMDRANDTTNIIHGTMSNKVQSKMPLPEEKNPVSAERQAELTLLRALENRNNVTGLYRHPSSYTREEVAAKVSLIIKTFERPSCLLHYLESIREYYPDMPILIADDSKQVASTLSEIMKMKNILYFPLPFDSGVSFGRNFLIDHVKTPFFIVSDDDNLFTNKTVLENLLADIEYSGAEIVGACNHEGDKECIGDWDLFYRNRVYFATSSEAAYSTLQVREVPHAYMEVVRQRDGTQDTLISPHCKEADMVANFFMSRTAWVAEKVRWDPYFKVGEHEDFFYRAKLAKAYIRFCTNVRVEHEHFSCLKTEGENRNYKTFRDRVRTLMDHFFVKHPPVTVLETPWATITWKCKCEDEFYSSTHLDECMSATGDGGNCSAVWDTDRVTMPVKDTMQQAAMRGLVQADLADTKVVMDEQPYEIAQGTRLEDKGVPALPPSVSTQVRQITSSIIENTLLSTDADGSGMELKPR